MPDPAVEAALRRVAAAPSDAGAWADLGGALLRARVDEDAAQEALDRAVALAPGHRQARLNRAALALRRARPAEALVDLDRALAAHPGHPALLGARATALLRCGDPDGALAALDAALQAAPDDPRLRWNRVLALLTAGRLREGLAAYGARRGRLAGTGARRLAGVPVWRGEPLSGRRVALVAEQGLGDTLQFVRFARALAARGAEVVAVVPRRLVALLAGVSGPAAVVALGGEAEVDLQVAMMDVPGLLGVGEEALDGAPYLRADPAGVAAWAPRVAGVGLGVGIAWQGNPTYEGEPHRSPPLAAFAPLAGVPGVRFVGLQHQHGREQLETSPLALDDLGPALDRGPDGFVDTAAVLASLDLVITSDTALAHLAGALGRPTWVVLPHAPDWRWMLEREDSPWYATVRLFRQPAPGAWGPVFSAVAGVLARAVAGEEPP